MLRPTGPITAFISLLFNFSTTMEIEVSGWRVDGLRVACVLCPRHPPRPPHVPQFLTFLGWTGVFVSLYMVIISAFELSRYISLLTRFMHDIFAFFGGLGHQHGPWHDSFSTSTFSPTTTCYPHRAQCAQYTWSTVW